MYIKAPRTGYLGLVVMDTTHSMLMFAGLADRQLQSGQLTQHSQSQLNVSVLKLDRTERA